MFQLMLESLYLVFTVYLMIYPLAYTKDTVDGGGPKENWTRYNSTLEVNLEYDLPRFEPRKKNRIWIQPSRKKPDPDQTFSKKPDPDLDPTSEK